MIWIQIYNLRTTHLIIQLEKSNKQIKIQNKYKTEVFDRIESGR